MRFFRGELSRGCQTGLKWLALGLCALPGCRHLSHIAQRPCHPVPCDTRQEQFAAAFTPTVEAPAAAAPAAAAAPVSEASASDAPGSDEPTSVSGSVPGSVPGSVDAATTVPGATSPRSAELPPSIPEGLLLLPGRPTTAIAPRPAPAPAPSDDHPSANRSREDLSAPALTAPDDVPASPANIPAEPAPKKLRFVSPLPTLTDPAEVEEQPVNPREEAARPVRRELPRLNVVTETSATQTERAPRVTRDDSVSNAAPQDVVQGESAAKAPPRRFLPDLTAGSMAGIEAEGTIDGPQRLSGRPTDLSPRIMPGLTPDHGKVATDDETEAPVYVAPAETKGRQPLIRPGFQFLRRR